MSGLNGHRPTSQWGEWTRCRKCGLALYVAKGTVPGNVEYVVLPHRIPGTSVWCESENLDPED